MEWLGWIAAAILVVTLGAQVRKNWIEKKMKGVNPLLYWGQASASLCFALYSLSIDAWVFVISNVLGLVSAMIGIYLLYRYR